MSHARVTEVCCDLCGMTTVWDSLVEARANGWVEDRWRNGEVLDLCDRCAKDVGRERRSA